MSEKEIISSIALFLTFIASVAGLVVSLLNTRKTNYINAVTAMRMKWLTDMKSFISEFCGLIHHYNSTRLPKAEKRELIRTIDKLRFLIKLNLDAKDDFDIRFEEKIDAALKLTDTKHFYKLKAALDDIKSDAQKIVKNEWEGIKAEAVSGVLSKKTKATLRNQHLA